MSRKASWTHQLLDVRLFEQRGGGFVLEAQGVKYIFGIPGAKVDTIFDVLADPGPRLILCRHEQNAAFMAGMYGLLTGTPGVCLVTSGPGVTNLVTGLSTATYDGTWSGASAPTTWSRFNRC